MTLEETLQKHKPTASTANLPCASGMLWHLNSHGLMEDAIAEQIDADKLSGEPEDDKPVVINRLTAWKILAEAQRNGLRLEPHKVGVTERRQRREARQ